MEYNKKIAFFRILLVLVTIVSLLLAPVNTVYSQEVGKDNDNNGNHYGQEFKYLNFFKKFNRIKDNIPQANTLPPGWQNHMPIPGDALQAQAPANAADPESTYDNDPQPFPGWEGTTSAFMAGNVTVMAVFVESNGSIDDDTENWTHDMMDSSLQEINNALYWWQGRWDETYPENQVELSFNLSYIVGNTSYEPITHDSYTSLNGQGLWISEIMTDLGYPCDIYNYFDEVREYSKEIRDQNNDDWSFVIFIANDFNDTDHRFADSRFSYAYLGGPFMVTLYTNNGYGHENLDAIVAHEIGHIFRALDQYCQGSYCCQCDQLGGILQIPNYNCVDGCPSDVGSIMRGGVTPYVNENIDYYAMGHIGWRDEDSDGVLDILDNCIDTDAPPAPAPDVNQTDWTNTTSFNVSWTPVTDNGCSGLAGYRWSLDGGNFSELINNTWLNTPELTDGIHNVSIQSVDNTGNPSSVAIVQLKVDTSPPEASLTYPFSNMLVSNYTDISWNVMEHSGVAQALYSVDGGINQTLDFFNGSYRFNTSVWMYDEVHNFTACFTDNLNHSVMHEYEFNVTNLIPKTFQEGYNTFSMPVETGALFASQVPDLLQNNYTEIVSYFNETQQNYNTYAFTLRDIGIPQADFEIQPGMGFFVYLNHTSGCNLTGPDARDSVYLEAGYNLIGYNSIFNSTAINAFLNHSVNNSIELIARYDDTLQQYQTYSVVLENMGIPQADFPVIPGYAYFIYASGEDTINLYN